MNNVGSDFINIVILDPVPHSRSTDVHEQVDDQTFTEVGFRSHPRY